MTDHAQAIMDALNEGYLRGPRYDRAVAALAALSADLAAAREAAKALLEWAERFHAGDPSLDPEEWYIARDYARKVLAAGGREEPA